jgi:hypothetical protein
MTKQVHRRSPAPGHDGFQDLQLVLPARRLDARACASSVLSASRMKSRFLRMIFCISLRVLGRSLSASGCMGGGELNTTSGNNQGAGTCKLSPASPCKSWIGPCPAAWGPLSTRARQQERGNGRAGQAMTSAACHPRGMHRKKIGKKWQGGHRQETAGKHLESKGINRAHGYTCGMSKSQ